jgi:hypothetical protein
MSDWSVQYRGESVEWKKTGTEYFYSQGVAFNRIQISLQEFVDDNHLWYGFILHDSSSFPPKEMKENFKRFWFRFEWLIQQNKSR